MVSQEQMRVKEYNYETSQHENAKTKHTRFQNGHRTDFCFKDDHYPYSATGVHGVLRKYKMTRFLPQEICNS